MGVNQRWPLGRIAVAIACAVVPYATLPLDRSLERRGLLTGPWRREASDGSADGPVDRMLRIVLARPVLSVVVVAVAVTLAFSALLIIGPPRLPE